MAVFTDDGRADLTGILVSSGPQHIAWGDNAGATGEDVTNSALDNEHTEDRVAGTRGQVTTSVTDDTYEVVGTLVAEGSKDVEEAGLFDAITGGVMWIRGLFTGIPVEVDDSIEFTFELQFD